MKLQCKHCGIRGSSDLAFLWYGKKTDNKTAWLCPDCYLEFESDRERDQLLGDTKRQNAGR